MAPPNSLTFVRLLLASLAVTGVITIQLFARRNGLFELMAQFQSKHQFPQTSYSVLSPAPKTYDPVFTGLEPLDHILGVLVTFFWPVIDGSTPGLSVVGLAFGGQMVAAWTVTMLESVRVGNRGRAVSFTSVYGMLSQLLSMGVCAPVYLLLHTLTTPFFPPSSSDTTTTTQISKATTVPRNQLSTIPAAVTLGYIVPTILVTLPAPALIPERLKLQSHTVWQFFPLTCALAHLSLSAIWPRRSGGGATDNSTGNDIRQTRDRLRRTYKFALSLAAPAHLAASSLSFCAWAFPDLFQARYGAELVPGRVFVPPTAKAFATVFGGGGAKKIKVSAVGEGALWFIQWDYVLVGAAYLMWAAAARAQVGTGGSGLGVGDLAKLAWRTCVLGPVGAALATIWERDEIAFETALEGRRKKDL